MGSTWGGSWGTSWGVSWDVRTARPGGVPGLRSALDGYLRADAALEALVGTRIRPGWRPQGDAVPALTYVVDRLGRRSVVAGKAGFNVASVELVAWAPTPAECVAVKARVEDLLDGFAGRWSGLVVTSCLQEEEHHGHAWPDDGTDAPCVRLAVRYGVRHTTRLAAMSGDGP
jgi:hypothetical protein